MQATTPQPRQAGSLSQSGRQVGAQLGTGPQASQGNSDTSRASSTSSWEGNQPAIPQ